MSDVDGTPGDGADADDAPADAAAGGPVEHVTVEAKDLSFACRYRGEGDRLALCLHGFPDDPGTFDPLLDDLAGAGFTAVAPYLRGHGPTDAAPDGDHTVGVLAREATALADALADDLDLAGGGSEGGDLPATGTTSTRAVGDVMK